jgi:hypothetical protein
LGTAFWSTVRERRKRLDEVYLGIACIAFIAIVAGIRQNCWFGKGLKP